MRAPMHCCENCGCYLPDGATRCLACGHDEHYHNPKSWCDPDEMMMTTLDDIHNQMIISNPIRAVSGNTSRRYTSASGNSEKGKTGRLLQTLYGPSCEQKPTGKLAANLAFGSRFVEIDTGLIYLYDSIHDEWVKAFYQRS